MDNVDQDHDCEHQQRIKDVQVDLVLNQAAVIALNVLDNSKYRSHEYKNASRIESNEVLVPRAAGRLGVVCRLALDCASNAPVTTTKSPKKASWMNSPTTITFEPIECDCLASLT